jgi:hypothetical protein
MRKTLLLLVLMLTVFGGVAAAQDVPQTFCGTLSDSDCTILTDSAAAMRDLHSAAFTFQLDVGLDNIPEGRPSEINLRLTGDGSYAIDPEALSALMLSPSDMMQNMDKMPQILEDAIKAISADATLVLYLPQNMPDMDQPLPEKVGLSLRMVDGIGYANMDKLAQLDTSGDLPRGWVGIDLAGLLRQAMDSQAGSMGGMSSMTGMGANMDMMSAFNDPEFMNAFMTVTRVEDTAVDGQSAAVFNQAIDVGSMLSSDEFQKMMRDQMDAAMGSTGSSGLSESDLDSIMSMYSNMFKGFVVNTSQTIGLDDHYMHQMNMTLDWALDFSSMMGSMGASSAKTPPINISISFQGGLSQFNNAPEITSPEDAEIIPMDDLFGGF